MSETVQPIAGPAAVAAGPPVSPPAARRTPLEVAAFAVLTLVVAALAWRFWMEPAFRTALGDSAAGSPDRLSRTLLTEFFLNPWFYAVILLVAVLEWAVPAKRQQRFLSRGVLQDLAWVFFKLVAQAWALPFYVVFLRHLFDRHLSFLTIDAVAAWPWGARFALALLFGDLVYYVTHVVRHKVSVLWYFHAVHHSQRELNFFTEYRVHPVDDLFVYTIGFVPIFMVDHSFVSVVAIVWLRHWHSRMYHSNIRSNLGPLRYVFVTPQSHRVHHSRDPRHHDTNFGLTFSLWDHLFGTQWRGYDEYPDTGIEDDDFPFEQGTGAFGVLSRMVGQLVYPFRAIARHFD
jgi:sterol desaturase/sphingolipid hydroxylase (fatty acid hydroxylase superfamily)